MRGEYGGIVHFHIAQLHTRRYIVSRIEKYAESSESGDEESDGREEAEDALGAVEGRVHSPLYVYGPRWKGGL